MKVLKNITQYNTKDHSFNGYRLTKSFRGQRFLKYYSVKVYGSFERAEKASIIGRNKLEEILSKATLVGGKLSTETISNCEYAMDIHPTSF